MSVRALVQMEAQGLQEMRDALTRAAHVAAGLIADSDQSKQAIVDAIQASCKTLDADLEVIIVEIQKRAADVASDVIVIELTQLGVDYDEIDYDEEDMEDEARADASSSSFTAAFLLAALAMLALRPKPDFKKLAMLQDYRLKRISGTETFMAYERSLQRYYSQLAVSHPELKKRWDAQLDACPVCQSMNGDVVAIGSEFRSGLVPGSVHINCRCVETLLPT